MIAYSRAYTNSTSTKREGKTKTAESQMNERGRGLKPTSDEFMESVLETRKEMIVHNDLCNLLAWPSRKIVSKLGCCHIVIWTRWATHRTALGRELFQQCCKKQNHHQPSARSQRLSLHLHVPWRVHSDWKQFQNWLPQQHKRRRRARWQWKWRWVPAKVVLDNNET